MVFGAFGALALGVALARAYVVAVNRVQDDAAVAVLSFLVTFGVWLLADALGVSAVLAMVAFAVALARSAPERLGARERRASYAVWEVATFTLNVLAFVLIGLQLRGILERSQGSLPRFALVAVAVLMACVRFGLEAGRGGARRRAVSHRVA